MLFDHRINWEESTVLKYVNSYRGRLIAESWFINAHTNVINRSDGETLPSVPIFSQKCSVNAVFFANFFTIYDLATFSRFITVKQLNFYV